MRKTIVKATLLALSLILSVNIMAQDGDGAPPLRVLLLQDGASEMVIQPILEAAGCEVVPGGNVWQFRGRVDLASFDTVVLLDDGQAWLRDMPNDGQQALVDYIRAGGGLVTTEWLLWATRVLRDYQILRQVFLGASDAVFAPVDGETYTVLSDHPIAYGLPVQFGFERGAASPLTGFDREHVIILGSQSRDAVIAAPVEGGRVVHWSLGPSYRGFPDEENIPQLLVNMVYWAGGGI